MQASSDEMTSQMPYITFCPIFTDSFFTTVIGVESKAVTMDKMELLMRRNFLKKSFQYKGFVKHTIVDSDCIYI